MRIKIHLCNDFVLRSLSTSSEKWTTEEASQVKEALTDTAQYFRTEPLLGKYVCQKIALTLYMPTVHLYV